MDIPFCICCCCCSWSKVTAVEVSGAEFCNTASSSSSLATFLWQILMIHFVQVQ